MDYHPIPQNVTGFQFKLIGSMTLRQFTYVAFGVILATIVYFLPVNIFIKIFFIPLFGISGLIVAFVPIEGRSIDIMLINFIKALFSPNQYIYNKSSQVDASPGGGSSPQVILQPSQTEFKNKVDEKETVQSLNQPQAQITPVMPSPNIPQENTTSLEEQVRLMQNQKQLLEQQLKDLQLQLAASAKPTSQPQPPPLKPAPNQHVHSLSIDMAKKAGLPLVSDTPNVIVGIVKDARGNVLSGMLIEIKDKDGNPVRAFKTNQLGQFASATPLVYGPYVLEVEDPKKQHLFDKIQLEATNQIMLPLEIISHDEREELRKELFT